MREGRETAIEQHDSHTHTPDTQLTIAAHEKRKKQRNIAHRTEQCGFFFPSRHENVIENTEGIKEDTTDYSRRPLCYVLRTYNREKRNQLFFISLPILPLSLSLS